MFSFKNQLLLKMLIFESIIQMLKFCIFISGKLSHKIKTKNRDKFLSLMQLEFQTNQSIRIAEEYQYYEKKLNSITNFNLYSCFQNNYLENLFQLANFIFFYLGLKFKKFFFIM